MRRPVFVCAVLVTLLTHASAVVGAPRFSVTFADTLRKDPATGRLVVYLIRDGAQVGPASPADGPFWYDPQPLYGIDVRDLKPGEAAGIDDSATAFGPKLSDLPQGWYRAQAVLDLHHDDSSWRREPGNLCSESIRFEVKPGADQSIEISLCNVVRDSKPRQNRRAQVFQIRSRLLSEFRGKDVILRAAVVFPDDYDAARFYPAVYEVPGFGGNHTDGLRMTRCHRTDAANELARNVFWITLDPESPNGHTLFADSDVNGPCGKALVSELIPALEANYSLIAQPSARMLRGHSSGGWSTLWLATQYPDVFGACWSSSPDPVDFRKFELIDIYNDDNAYFDKTGKEIPSTRRDDKMTLSVRGENQQEEVLGTANSSAQQWDSWQAVYGTRGANGWPKPLFDAASGKIDHVEAEHYERYDIGLLLRENPRKYGPIFLQRVRLICGDADDFYLNEAVELLRADLEKIEIENLPEGKHGYIKMVPGAGHGSVFGSEAMQSIKQEMLDHLRRTGHTPSAARGR